MGCAAAGVSGMASDIVSMAGAALTRLRVRLDDRIRGSAAAADTIACAGLLAHSIERLRPVRTAGAHLPETLRLALRFARERRIQAATASSFERWRASCCISAAARPGQARLRSSLIVKPPGPGAEKGVLFLGAERDLTELVTSTLLPAVQRDYTIFALSAWSPPNPKVFAAVARAAADPVHIGVSHLGDAATYHMYGPKVVSVPLMASDWLNPAEFTPIPAGARDIDLIMVASWGRYKRHWLLFEALRTLPRTLRVVLVGTPSEGRSLEDVRAEAALWGVKQEITFVEDLSIEDVYQLQGRSRIAVQFSGREGSCVAVTEAMMAGTPVGVPADSHIGAAAHINDHTGRLLPRRELGRALGLLIEQSSEFNPHRWLTENACYATSVARLECHLAESAPYTWSRGIFPVHRRRQRLFYVDTTDHDKCLDAAVALARQGLVLDGYDELLLTDPALFPGLRTDR
jgi:glycosyltransferase involved in cell wall biosynthesis